MKSSEPKNQTKEWKDMSADEKRNSIFVWLTIFTFIIFWISSDFLSALGMVLIFWSLYFLFKAVRLPESRIKYAGVALALFLVGGLIVPTSTESPKESVANVDAKDLEDKKLEAEKVKRAELESQKKEAERLAKEKAAAEKKDRERRESLAQQIKPTGSLYQVASITDGDTIKVNINGAVETIRFIGMDTPETKDPRKPVQCFGFKATSKMQSYAQSKKVRLEADGSQGDRDRYGRLLRYVYTDDGKNIAYEMIKGGFAHEYTYNLPYKYQAQFKTAQKYARDNDKGLWSPSTCNGNTNQQHAPKPKPEPSPKPQAATPPSNVYYKNCTAARDAGAAPVYRGQPGYGSHLDRDNDGIGCE